MLFIETPISGAFAVDLEPRGDDRGFFARAFCADEFAAHGLSMTIAQANLSWSAHAGTMRGLHFQLPPFAESKFIRCVRGAVFDVIVDLRPESVTFGQHVGMELSAENRRAMFVPERCAHGLLTLTDDSEVFYPVGAPYQPGLESGLRFDDPDLDIDWPIAAVHITEKDRSWPSFAARIDEIRQSMSLSDSAPKNHGD